VQDMLYKCVKNTSWIACSSGPPQWATSVTCNTPRRAHRSGDI